MVGIWFEMFDWFGNRAFWVGYQVFVVNAWNWMVLPVFLRLKPPVHALLSQIFK
jgi:hypothetical protein